MLPLLLKRRVTTLRKDTIKIVEELGICTDFHTFYDENKDYLISNTLAELLKELVEKKKLKKTKIIKASELSEIYAYQIFSGLRIPDRRKLLSLAVGMELDVDEVQTLLKCAGYPPLYAKLPFDCAVIYGFNNKLSVLEINSILFKLGLETLG